MSQCDPEYLNKHTLIKPRETEFVAAGKLQEGDEMPRYGTVTRVLNDSTVLSVDTTDPPYGFCKSQHAPMERYVRDPNGVYGLEWCRQQTALRQMEHQRNGGEEVREDT